MNRYSIISSGAGADGNGMAAVPVRASRQDPAALTDREAATAWGD